ncbi:MAG: PBSX family phage terminase large subunit [Methanobrevibacter sp.]|nr:PBSX family phage terminase large subunit [Methanobrevibacter sp.]
MAKSTMSISPAFDNFIFDWDYETYLSIGSYGSGKSHAVVQKIILKLFTEKRKCCVFRDVYDTHKESTFDLIKQILEDMSLLADVGVRKHKTKVCFKNSPLEFKFPNGSRIIFKGMDSTEKLKSLNGVSIVWIEECSEVTLDAYLEILGRIRTPGMSMHFILTCNPVGKFNWVYQRFFEKINEDGSTNTILNDEILYERKTLVKRGVYYHHSTCDDNPFLPREYIQRLDEIKTYDKNLWVVARLGRFGSTGMRVLPQFEVMQRRFVNLAISQLPEKWHRIGFDFGFETSYNALIKVAVDDEHKWLYIYDEYYKNHMTDDKTAEDLIDWDEDIKEQVIKADNAEPKTIQYFKQQGYKIRPCKKKCDKKSEGSRLANTKKVKRFKRIICSTSCPNTIKELKDLTYQKNKDGSINPSQFNIDAHTLSAIWYALDDYIVADLKERKSNSVKGK